VVPPYAFRRLKEDVAKDLPPKHEGPMIRRLMPPIQAKRYAELSAATQSKQFSLLRALHDFRSISLHPADPEAVGAGAIQPDEYIEMSARLTEAFRKLADVAIKNEKALIFVNSRRIQNVLARLIAYKFGCPKPEFIRGDTVPSQRQEIVNRFSAMHGFAVLILSPRAAGVGLNIVAANHVIHLDRWWNPAVEDQCTDRAYRCTSRTAIFYADIAISWPTKANTNNHGNGHSDEPTN
jgi:SNF2 family DNA or RNA helicase